MIFCNALEINFQPLCNIHKLFYYYYMIPLTTYHILIYLGVTNTVNNSTLMMLSCVCLWKCKWKSAETNKWLLQKKLKGYTWGLLIYDSR